MDLSTIIGLVTVNMIIIAIIDSGGIDIFTSGSAYLIVIGGTLLQPLLIFRLKRY